MPDAARVRDAASAAEERQRADPDRHQAADPGHHRQEQLAADPRRRGDDPEQHGQHQGDRGQPDALDRSARGSADRRLGRPASAAARSARSSLRPVQVPRHQVTGDRRRDLAAAAGLLDDHGDRDLRVVSAGANPMNHECGSPVPPSSAVPDLPAVVTPGTFAPVVNWRPRSPSTAWTIAALMARAFVGGDDPAHRRRPDRPRPARLPVIAVTRRGCISSPSFATVDATSAIWSGVTKVSACPYDGVRELDVVGEAAGLRAVAVGHLRDRGRQVERQRRAEAHPVGVRRRGWRRPSAARSARSRCCTTPRSRRPGRAPSSPSPGGARRGPGSRRPAGRSSPPPGCCLNVVSGVIAPDPRPATAVTILNTEPGT